MFANYRKQPIRKFAQDAKDGKYIATEENNLLLRLSIDIIWNRTKTLEPVYLSTLTHLSNSAWYKAWQREVGSSLSVAELTEDTTYLATLQVPSHISF